MMPTTRCLADWRETPGDEVLGPGVVGQERQMTTHPEGDDRSHVDDEIRDRKKALGTDRSETNQGPGSGAGTNSDGANMAEGAAEPAEPAEPADPSR